MKQVPALAFAVLTMALTSTTVAAQQAQANQAQAATSALINFEVKNNAIAASLTGKPGNPEKGRRRWLAGSLEIALPATRLRRLARSRSTAIPDPRSTASRAACPKARSACASSMPTKANAETMMPPFYRVEGFNRVLPSFQGKTIFTAEQVEDVVAFMMTLKE